MITPQSTRGITLNEALQTTNPEDELIKSCCFTLDKKGSLFFAKIGISLLSFFLCSYQLVQVKNDCPRENLYSGILIFVISSWLR